jgi:hypothetical protein
MGFVVEITRLCSLTGNARDALPLCKKQAFKSVLQRTI